MKINAFFALPRTFKGGKGEVCGQKIERLLDKMTIFAS